MCKFECPASEFNGESAFQFLFVGPGRTGSLLERLIWVVWFSLEISVSYTESDCILVRNMYNFGVEKGCIWVYSDICETSNSLACVWGARLDVFDPTRTFESLSWATTLTPNIQPHPTYMYTTLNFADSTYVVEFDVPYRNHRQKLGRRGACGACGHLVCTRWCMWSFGVHSLVHKIISQPFVFISVVCTRTFRRSNSVNYCRHSKSTDILSSTPSLRFCCYGTVTHENAHFSQPVTSFFFA